jgi:hypothetical protein
MHIRLYEPSRKHPVTVGLTGQSRIVGPQHGTRFLSSSWHLKFGNGAYIFGIFFDPRSKHQAMKAHTLPDTVSNPFAVTFLSLATRVSGRTLPNSPTLVPFEWLWVMPGILRQWKSDASAFTVYDEGTGKCYLAKLQARVTACCKDYFCLFVGTFLVPICHVTASYGT